MSSLPFGEGQDPVLGKGDEAEVDDVAELLAKLQQGAERGERRVADVDVGADESSPLGDLPEDRLAGPRLHVLVGQRWLPLGPGEDPLDERARLVVARLADGQDGIEVDMGVDERRRQEPTLGVELDGLRPARRGEDARRADGGDPIALDEDVDGIWACPEGRVHAHAADDQAHPGSTTTSLGTTTMEDRSAGSPVTGSVASVVPAERRSQVGRGLPRRTVQRPSPRSDRRVARARESQLATVPSATLSIAAISRWV